MSRARTLTLWLMMLAVASIANASWYDDYDAGLAAARSGNWSLVVSKMSAAIKGQGSENNKARTYGMDYRNYHPYYYRGVAYLNLGKYEQAISDLEKTSGPGPENLGSIETLMGRAKKMLAEASAPEPEPTRPEPARPEPVRPTPTPVVPQIDPALRQRATTTLNTAKQKLQAAQGRKATGSPQYAQAMSMITDATTKNATARNNDDLQAIIALAESAGDLADLATAPAVATTTPTTPTVIPKPIAATTDILGDAQKQVRRALEFYFAGEFETATQHFKKLTETMPKNAWICSFLGASQFSLYAFVAVENYRRQAIQSFKKAKQHRNWKNGLPAQYFSKRIRRAFSESAG